MSNPTIQAQTNPTVKKNNPSDHEQADKELREAINAAKVEVDAQTTKGHWIERASWVLLIMYAALTLAIGLLTIWSNRQSRVTGNAATRFNDLQMANIRADAEYKIQVDTAKVREDAAHDLKIKTEEVRGEAGTKIEEAKAEARVKIEQAAAELTREQRKLSEEQRKTAEAQRAADEARLALEKHVEAVAKWQEDRRLVADFPDTRKIDPNLWQAAIRYKADDPEAFSFAQDIFTTLIRAGWYIQNDPYPIRIDPTRDVLEQNKPSIRPGVTVCVPPGENWQSRVKTLIRAFEESGAPLRLTAPFPGDNMRLVIIVGPKPAFSAK